MKELKLLLLAAVVVGVDTSVWGAGESYSVSTKAELKAALFNHVRQTITLTDDIDMAGEGPLVTAIVSEKYNQSWFRGTLDGNGHKIYNCPKLFEHIGGAETVIRNLTIIAPSDMKAGLSYQLPKGHDLVYQDTGVGVVAGWISGDNAVTLSNVHVSNANVEVLVPSYNDTTDSYYMIPVGGLVGNISCESVVSIRDCSVAGKVVSRNESSTAVLSDNQYACGGLIGSILACNGLEITNCTANVSVTAGNYLAAGGLIGSIKASPLTSAIVDCMAFGSVSGYQAGGFIGAASGKSPAYATWKSLGPGTTGDPRERTDFDWETLYFTFDRCRAANKLVSGSNCAGGFVGYADNNQRFSQCYSLGPIATGSYMGGFAGRANIATFKDCYALGDLNWGYKSGAFIGQIEGAADGVVSNEIVRAYGAGQGFYLTKKTDNEFFDILFCNKDDSTGSRMADCVAGTYETFTNAANFTAFLAAKDSSGNSIWSMTDGKTMPYFAWSLKDGKFTTYHDNGEGALTMEYTTPGQLSAGSEIFIGGYTLINYYDSLPYVNRAVSSVHVADNHRRPCAYIGKNIANAAAFQNITNDLQATYVLTADISIKTNGYTAVGDTLKPFRGTLVGLGHTVDFKVNDARDNLALFGYIGPNATIQDMTVNATLVGKSNVAAIAAIATESTIENCHVRNLSLRGENNVGGLVGQLINSSSVRNCSAQGAITAADAAVGGLVGVSEWYSSISDSSAEVTIDGTASDVGGLVGRSENLSGKRGSITRCYAAGAVSGAANAGGLIGYGDWVTIRESFALGAVTATGSVAGGFVGWLANGSIINDYALGAVMGDDHVGGFAGRAGDSCYFGQIYADNTIAANSSQKGALVATGNPTFTNAVAAAGDHAKMISTSTFTAFFDEMSGGDPVWSQIDGETEPYFAWSLKDGKFAQYYDDSYKVAITPGASFSLSPSAPVGEAFLQWTDSAPYGDTYALNGGGAVADNHRAHTYRTGTPIETVAELKAIAANGTYVLLNDIDTTESAWTPLCSDSAFTGEMIGRGHTVKINVSSSGLGAGLFAYVKGAHLYGITVSGSVTAQGLAGALVGAVVTPDPGGAATVIELCSGEADVTCTGDALGGLVGRIHPGASAEIYRSQASGTVTGASDVGGLVGMMEGGEISESFAYGRVIGSGEDAGGLIGHAYDGTVTDCYAIGLVTGAANVGAFVGNAASAVALTRVYGECAPLVGSGNPIQSSVICGNGDYDYLTSADHFGVLLASGKWSMTDGATEPYFAWSLNKSKYFAFSADGVRSNVLPGSTQAVTAAVPDGKAVLFWLNNGGSVAEDNRPTTTRFKVINHSRLHYTTATAISTRSDLMAIDNSASPYVLTNDLDISALEWQPLFAGSGAFTGYLEGHGYTIGLRHTVTQDDAGTGLFAALGNGAAVSNLVLTGELRAGSHVGALAGKVLSTTTSASIDHVFASNVVIYATTSQAGGLLGSVSGKLNVTDSAAEGTVSGNGVSSELIGGFVGWIGTSFDVSFARCRSAGPVSGVAKIGGFVGGAGAGAFSQCFAVGTAMATGSYAGGFAGVASSARFTDSYAVADVTGADHTGAFAGDTPSASVRCYGYRPNVDDYAAMTNAANWTTFLAEDCWTMTDGVTMPYLAWSVPNGTFTFYSERVNQSAAIGTDFTYAIPLEENELFVRWLGGYEFGDTLRHTTNLHADNFRYLRYSIGTKVRTQAELQAVSSRPNERPYVLMNDLDVSDGSFKPIGVKGAKFSGTFMGEGHVLTVDRPVFDYIQGATIEDVVLTGTISNCTDYLNAALVAHASGTGEAMTNYINRCVASNLTLVATGANVGGLIAEVGGRTVVENCRVIAEISGKATTVGGLVGKIESIASRFYRNAVYAHIDMALPDGETVSEVGGFAGDAGGATYAQNYVIGTVAGEGKYVAGFAATADDAAVTDSYVYAEVASPLGWTDGFIDDEDNHVSLTRTYGYNPRTDTARYATMTNAANWAVFLAEDCWAMTDGKTMPYLKWSVTDGQFDLYDRAQLFHQSVGEVTPYAAHPPAGRAFVEWLSGLSYDQPFAVEAHERADNHRYPTYRTGAAITSAAELAAMDETDGVYVVVNDIDATGTAWTPAFSAAQHFSGEFHGRGHTISLSGTTSAADMGFFAVVSNAWITDVTFVGSLTGGDRTGALAGRVLGTTGITNVTSRVTVSGGSSVGGLVGLSEGAASYYRCRTLNDVTGLNFTGGFIGSFSDGTIDECYALGQVKGGMSVGGFAGALEGGTVRDAYALGEVFADDPCGGFAGEIAAGATVVRAYCEQGDFTDEATSAGTWTGCVTGEGHPEILTNRATFAAFCSASSVTPPHAPVWTMEDGVTMPYFAWSLDAGAFDFYCNDQVNRRTRGTAGEVHEDTPTTVALAEWTDNLPYADKLEPITTLYAANHRRLHYRTGLALRTMDELEAVDNSAATYVVLNDIIVSDPDRVGIGASEPFCGELLGRHFTVQLADKRCGLFASVSNAVVRRLTIDGLVNRAPFAQCVQGASAFTDCKSLATISSIASVVGGFADEVAAGSTATFDRCSVYSIFDQAANNGYYPSGDMGGFVGRALGGTFRECFTISSFDSLARRAGGFAGSTDAATFADCYALGDVTASLTNGAFIGWASANTRLTRVYADGKVYQHPNFSGRWVNASENRFIGNETAGDVAQKTDCVYRDGDYAKMTNATTFAAFLANGNWSMEDGKTEPYFAWSIASPNRFYLCNCGIRMTWQMGHRSDIQPQSMLSDHAFMYWLGSAPLEDFEAEKTFYSADNHRTILCKSGWEIKDADDLAAIERGKDYVVVSNIVCDTSWSARCTTSAPYWGEFYGRGHTITLFPTNGTLANGGLFAAVCDAKIRDLTVEGLITGGNKLGAFAGAADHSEFLRCASFAEVRSSAIYLGGFVGFAEGNSAFNECFAIAPVIGQGNTVGGFAGEADRSSFTDCYALGDVQGNLAVGAFAGVSQGSRFTRVYSDGTSALSTGRRVVTRTDKFVDVDYDSTLTDCIYRLADRSAMTNAATFAAFLANGNWSMEDGVTMPYFDWSLKDERFVCYEHTGSTNVTRGTTLAFAATPFAGQAFSRWYGGFDFTDPYALTVALPMTNHRHPHYRTGFEVNDVAGLSAMAEDKDYVLVTNVDASAVSDLYLSGAFAYTGEFFGRGHEITTGGSAVKGLFPRLSSAWVRDLKLVGNFTGHASLVDEIVANPADETLIENIAVEGLALTAEAGPVGGLVGAVREEAETVISNCTVRGDIELKGAVASAGGFVGALESTAAHLFRNEAAVAIGEKNNPAPTHVGGFVGSFTAGTVDEVFTVGPVTLPHGDTVGGFAGAVATNAILRDAYALGEVLGGTNGTVVGTFAGAVTGDATIQRVYSDGLAWHASSKRHKPAATNFFGTGTTANLGAWVQREGDDFSKMTNAATFAEFCSASSVTPPHAPIWSMIDGATEPYFAWSLKDGQFRLTASTVGDIVLPTDGLATPGETVEIVGADAEENDVSISHAYWLYHAPFADIYAPTGHLAAINHRYVSAQYGKTVKTPTDLAAISNSRDVYVITRPIVAPSFTPNAAKDTDAFKGELYGRHHLVTITNSASAYYYQGLFGYTGGSYVRDVVLSGTIYGYCYVGGFAGHVNLTDLNPTEFFNCETTNLTIAVTGGTSIGGLVGRLSQSSGTTALEPLFVTNCTIRGAICPQAGTAASSYVSDAGGLVGEVCGGYGTFIDSSTDVALLHRGQYQGGFVGRFRNIGTRGSFFTNCTARGEVRGGVYSYIGGFSGCSNEGHSYTNVFVNCAAYGDVSGGRYCGGFMGYASGGYDFSYCSAYGKVDSSSEVGGFVGNAGGSNTSPLRFYRCRAAGTVKGGGTYIGGFVGAVGSQKMNYDECYALGDVSGAAGVGGFTGAGSGTYDSMWLTNCYALGSVKGEGMNKGGFAGGWGKGTHAERCYAAGRVSGSSDSIGGFVGAGYYSYQETGISNCVWQTYGDGLNDTGNQNQPGRITSYAYAGMTNAANWATFLADDAWAMKDGATMPYLKWSAPDGTFSVYTDEHASKVGGGTITASATSAQGGESVTLTATPQDDNFFHNWTGFAGAENLPRPSAATVTVPLDNHRTISAHYGVYIDDVAEFKAMTDEVGGIYQLRVDLDLADEDWSPLFQNTSGKKFTGILYGANHVIDHLVCTNSPGAYFYPSLLGSLSGAEVHDLTVRGRVEVWRDNLSYAGGLAGSSDAAFFTNCVAEVTVVNRSATMPQCGGFIGNADGSRFMDCRATGDVQAKTSSRVGGFCAYTAYSSPSTFIRCTALGDVCGGSQVGGFSGYGGGSVFIGCRADGFVWGTNGRYVGGLIGDSGETSYSKVPVTIVDSFARGDVRGDAGSHIGGLIGANYAVVSNCWCSGSVWGYAGNSQGVCAMIGYNRNLVTNCFFRAQSGNRVAVSGGTWYAAPMDEAEYAKRAAGLPEPVERMAVATPIATVDQLLAITNDLGGAYALVADLDLRKLRNWTPFGTSSKPFYGEFYGGNHSISNFHVLATNASDLAFFGYVKGARIEGLKLYGKVEQVVTNTTTRYTGGLASQITEGALIRECAFVGDVNTTVADGVSGTASTYTGPLAGLVNADTALFERCATVGFAAINGNGEYLGGFAGSLNRYGRYFDCYAFVSLTNSQNCVGGFSYSADSGSTFGNCWCYGRVHDPDWSMVNLVGGFYASGSGTFSGCYLNAEAAAPFRAKGGWRSPGSDTTGIGNLTSNEFTVASNFVGYDFDSVWAQGKNAPYLRCLGELTYVEAVSLYGYALWAAEHGFSEDRAGTTDGIANLFRYAFDKPTGAFDLFTSFTPTAGGATIVTPAWVNTEDVTLRVASTDDLEEWEPSYAGFRYYDLPASGTLDVTDLPHPDNKRFFRLTAE